MERGFSPSLVPQFGQKYHVGRTGRWQVGQTIDGAAGADAAGTGAGDGTMGLVSMYPVYRKTGSGPNSIRVNGRGGAPCDSR